MSERAKPTLMNRNHPMWGKCELCEHEDFLVMKGGSEGLCLVCSVCDEEISQVCYKMAASQ